MDEQVIAAMARWPDVPAVYGWLSVSESGQWRLHPGGTALLEPTSPGEAITSPQILAFLERNYEADPNGQWYFQNGPQRVYVRLDAAPLVAHTTTDSATGRLRLRTHTGLDIRQVQALYLDETGRMYAATDRGPSLIAGRDLPALLDALQAADAERDTALAPTVPAQAGGAPPPDAGAHEALAHCLETGATVMLRSAHVLGFPSGPIPLHHCPRTALETALGFRRLPQASEASPPASAAPPDQPAH